MRAQDLTVGCGLDWGNASPGVVGWLAVLPDGHVHVFDEFKFQRMTVETVAKEIKERTRGWGVRWPVRVYADPSLRADSGQIGESIGQTFGRYGVGLTYPSNARVSGWQRLHEALAVDPATGTPWLTVHPRCLYGCRTVPLLVQSAQNPEDVETASDDHWADMLRYALMGGLRPSTGRRDHPPPGMWSSAWMREREQSHGRGVLA